MTAPDHRLPAPFKRPLASTGASIHDRIVPVAPSFDKVLASGAVPHMHALAYNLANFMRTLALPEAVAQWSLTSLREKLIKIGAKVVRHARYAVFQTDGRGRGAEGTVRENTAPDRRAATTAGSGVGLNGADASSPREECV